MAVATDKELAEAARVSWTNFKLWRKQLTDRGYKVTIHHNNKLSITKEVRL